MQATFTFIVLDEGGTPLLSVPSMDSEKLNIITAFIFAIEGLSKILDKESESYVFYTSNHLTAYMKHQKLIFVLITSRDIGEKTALDMLKDLASIFIDRYGEDPDEIRGAIMMSRIDVEKFEEQVINIAGKYVNNVRAMEGVNYFEEMLQELQRRGLLGEKLSKLVILANVPILRDKKALDKEKDDTRRKILVLCDGSRTIDEITKLVGMPKIMVMKILTELQKKGIVEIKTKYLFSKISK